MYADLIRHNDAQYHRAQATGRYMTDLRTEMQAALMDDPQAMVETIAGYPPKTVRRPAADVIHEDLTEQDMHEVLRLLGAAAKGDDVQLRALLLLSTWAERHAQSVVDIADAEGWIE